jgi:hypothetical protein
MIIWGCGGGGGGDTTTATITRAQFIARANAACLKFHKQAQTELFSYLKSGGGEPEDPDALAAYQADLGRRFVIGVKRRELAEFRALGLPSDDGGKAKAVIVAFEKGIGKAEQDPAGAAKDSAKSLGGAEKLAVEYGLTGC